jgi:hypothetical protein
MIDQSNATTATPPLVTAEEATVPTIELLGDAGGGCCGDGSCGI